MTDPQSRRRILVCGTLLILSALGVAPTLHGSARMALPAIFDDDPPEKAPTGPDRISSIRQGTEKKTPEQGDSATSSSKPQDLVPQVEVFVPSLSRLAESAKRSKTAGLYSGLAGMFAPPEDETGEDFDFAALVKLLEQVSTWPDTSLVFATFTQDREGRARWAARVDWPLADLRTRLEGLLKLEATAKILKDVRLRKEDGGGYRLELPDTVLAVLTESDQGSLIASADGVRLPKAIFGRDYTGEPPADQKPGDTGEPQPARKNKKPNKSLLAYCRLNLAAGEEDDGSSPFAMISGVKDVRYACSLTKDGEWSEKLVISWNPLVGAALKAAFQRIKDPYECPREAYAVAAFNAALGEGLADMVAGLPPETLGRRISDGTAFSAVPGVGFLPFPDLYFQFTTRGPDKVIESIRKVIQKDTREREDEDRPPAWEETTIDGRPVFCHNAGAEGGFSIMPVSYRTVIFFDAPRKSGETESNRLVIAYSSGWADDAVHHWQELTKTAKTRVAVPDTEEAHWQARISWQRVYALLQPYLSLLAGLSEGSAPPTAEELAESLADTLINIRIDYGGLLVQTTGPIPIGAVYVPAATATSLGNTSDPRSEAERERVACQHLRVLYHHAGLFKKDYGRWPATVAELDGYVDFASHADLLRLVPKREGFATNLVSMFAERKARAVKDEDRKIDDSLYVIDWSPGEWKLKIREGELVNWRTIYIDQDEEIHRVVKDAR